MALLNKKREPETQLSREALDEEGRDGARQGVEGDISTDETAGKSWSMAPPEILAERR
jgi:hypothetical protein